MPLLSQMYPGNFAAFYSTTTWTRGSAAYLAATGNMPPPVPVPLSLEYSQALAASLAQAGHPVYPLGLPMPLSLTTDSKKKAKASNITKFTIDEILGNSSKDEEEDEEVEIEVDSDDEEKGRQSASPRTDHTSPVTSPALDTDDPNTRFSWLQCTRYKPPKLPREYHASLSHFINMLTNITQVSEQPCPDSVT